MAQPLLNGEQEYVIDAPDPHLQELEAEVRELKRKLAHAELETRHAREDIGHVLGNLQRMTKPFLDLLKAVHGEIEAAGFSPAPRPLPLPVEWPPHSSIRNGMLGSRNSAMEPPSPK